jgi:capsule polysaccharide export protein KpsE/RkpR
VNPSGQVTVERADDDLMLTDPLNERAVLDSAVPQDSPFWAVTRLLWRQRSRLRKPLVWGLVLTAVLVAFIPNRFDASVQLMPPDSSASSSLGMLGALMSGSSSGGGAASSMGGLAGGIGELLGGQRPGALFVGVLSSRTIADRLIDRFDLRKVYWRKTYLATRKKLASNVDITEDKKTGIIRITVSDHDRARSQAMAQAYVEELNRLLAQVNTSAASRERAFLEQRLDVIHKELQDSSQRLSEFSSKNATFDPEDQGKAMVEATASLQGQLIAAQSELQGLEQIYTAENVKVRSLKANVAELQAQLNNLGGKDYNGSQTLSPNDLYPSLRQLPVLGVKYADLYGRVKIDETVYALLTEEYEMARVQEAKETPSVKVLDAAQLPEKPAWPPRLLLVAIGGFLGLMVGSCWIVGHELWSEVDDNEPYKRTILEIWSETGPFRASLINRLSWLNVFSKWRKQ